MRVPGREGRVISEFHLWTIGDLQLTHFEALQDYVNKKTGFQNLGRRGGGLGT